MGGLYENYKGGLHTKMSFEDFQQQLKCFWANNLVKNYKKISVAIGTTINIVVSTLIGHYVTIIPIWAIGILYAIQALVNVLVISFFGSRENGDGYLEKDILKLIREDERLEQYITSRILLKRLKENKALLKNTGEFTSEVRKNITSKASDLRKKMFKNAYTLKGVDIGLFDKIE